MKLTKLQRKTLQFFDSFRSTPPTIVGQLSFNWFATVPLLAVLAISVAVAFVPGFMGVAWLWIGLALGALSRDIGRYRGVVRVWPIYREIIHWHRVSELLHANEEPDAEQAVQKRPLS